MIKLFGIKVGIHWSWWVFLVFFFFVDMANGDFSPVKSFVILIMLTFSILGHELAHSLAAKWLGYETKFIKLHIMGGVAMVMMHNPKPSETIFVSAAGPAFNLISAMLGLSIFILNPFGITLSIGPQDIVFSAFGLSLIFFISINLLLGLFNLIPAYPMDGGRILRAALNKNPELAKKVSVGFSLFFASIFLFLSFVTGNIFLFLIAGFICYVVYYESLVVKI